MNQSFFDFPKPNLNSFESFVTCEGNITAYRFAIKISDKMEAEKLLYIYGPSGSGKSHLLNAIADSYKVTPISGKDISSNVELLKLLSQSSAMLIDDIDKISESEEIKSAIWEMFNQFHTAGKPVVATASLPPKELSNFDDHLISRFLWGLVAKCDVSDDNSRVAILKKRAADYNVIIPDDVVEYILFTTPRGAGELLKAFDNLYNFSIATKKKISVSLAKKMTL